MKKLGVPTSLDLMNKYDNNVAKAYKEQLKKASKDEAVLKWEPKDLPTFDATSVKTKEQREKERRERMKARMGSSGFGSTHVRVQSTDPSSNWIFRGAVVVGIFVAVYYY